MSDTSKVLNIFNKIYGIIHEFKLNENAWNFDLIFQCMSKDHPSSNLPFFRTGLIRIGNQNIFDFSSREIHNFAVARNERLVELALEYASIVGSKN